MKELSNAKELAQLIELYKVNKLSEHAIEKELSLRLQELAGPVDIMIKIIEDKQSTTNSTFGIATLPEFGLNRAKVSILIEKNAIKTLFSSEEMLLVLINEVLEVQKILKKYSEFNLKFVGTEVTLDITLRFYLELYKQTIENLFFKLPAIAKKVLENKSMVTPENIQEEIDLIDSARERMDIIIERLKVKDHLPEVFIQEAISLVKHIRAGYTGGPGAQVIDPEVPSMNTFRGKALSLSDKTYTNMKGKEISPFYKPNTNQ
jgi:hypothetical protein